MKDDFRGTGGDEALKKDAAPGEAGSAQARNTEPSEPVRDLKNDEAAAGGDEAARREFHDAFCFEAVIEFLPDATFVVDRERRVIAWNRAIEEMTGVPKDEILGRGDYEYALPFYGRRRPVLIDIAAAGTGEAESLYNAVTRDGDTLFSEVFCPLIGRGRGAYLWVKASPLFDENGEPAGAVETIRDITARKQAERALIVSEEKYRSIFENAVEGIFRALPSGRLSSANPAMARILGYDSEADLSASGLGLDDVFQGEGEWEKILRTLESGGSVFRRDMRIQRCDGESAWVSMNAVIASGKSGGDFFVEGTMTDVTRRRRAEQGFDRQKAMFQQLFANSPRAIVQFDEQGGIKDVNPSFEYLLGYGPEEIAADPSLIVPDELRAEQEAFRRSIMAGEVLSSETLRRHKSGNVLPVSVMGFPFRFQGKIAGGFIVYGDISKRKQYEKRLTHQAMHDGLTGLPNRTLFMDRLQRAVGRRKRRDEYSFAVLMCDLDRFKRINDSMGHSSGDQLLKQVGRRISEAVRSMDTVARLGGDEFAVLLEECRTPGEAVAVTRRILQRIREPLDIGGQFIRVGTSIGMVLKTADYDNPEDILRDADISMYRAKDSGRNRFKVFNRVMHEQAVRVMRLEEELRRATARGELFPVFQPILCAESLVPLGFEALLRWDHPERGIIMPKDIVPVAEESDLIEKVGARILEDACETMARWHRDIPDAGNLYLSVNLSARQFQQPDLVDMIRSILEKTGFSPTHLKLELTETVIMRNQEAALAKLNRLREMGMGIAVDDFGTGWSSLASLQRYPVTTLKVDQGFVSKMVGDPGSLEIVRAVVFLGRGLGVDVVAEGVEEDRQLQLLRMLGCAQVQGFLFHSPLTAAQAEDLLRSKPLRRWR